jgi:diguanylate cyclase (GGDEF)-like protein
MSGSNDPIDHKLKPQRAALRFAFAYAVFAGLWIGVSDLAMEWLFTEPADLVRASLIKGWIFVMVTAVLLYFLVARLIASLNDAVEAKEAIRYSKNRELQAGQERLRLALETGEIGALEMNPLTRATVRTAMFDRLFGYSEPLGDQPVEFFFKHLMVPDAKQLRSSVRQSLEKGEEWSAELQIRRADGEFCWLRARARGIPMAKESGHAINVIIQDITVERDSRQRIEDLAFRDQLTGLPNRPALFHKLAQRARADVQDGPHGAILVLDIEGLKIINELQGYKAGDALLKAVAGRLQDDLGERMFLARIAGDQFAVLADPLGEDEDMTRERADSLAHACLDLLERPHDCAPELLGLQHSTSIGICLYPSSNAHQGLLNKAEMALEKAKREGRNLIHFYTDELQCEAEARSQLENALRKALPNQELRLVLQSQFDADSRLTGAEALLRWEHPDMGPVSPGQFIPIAESTGLILPIGQMVLDHACRCLKEWENRDETRNLTLSVNISARQFHQPDFVEQLARTIKHHAIHPSHLVLELTESVVLENLELARERMDRIRSLGIHLALDDFGTGYSSLSYLKRLPFDQLKIDRSFVNDMEIDVGSAAIVRTIVRMGRALGLRTVAEGVETPSQWHSLREAGCNSFQGFLFARPVPIDQWSPDQETGSAANA